MTWIIKSSVGEKNKTVLLMARHNEQLKCIQERKEELNLNCG